MGTKEQLLAFLEEHKGTFLSGAQIADQLRISRTAVWKAVNNLRDAGYAISAVPKKGYCLDIHTDILSVPGLRRYLSPDLQEWDITILPRTDSTSNRLRELANHGTAEGCVLLANEQDLGRGRPGKSFFSPPDTGIYMSLLLRPVTMVPEQAVKITVMAAVAACRAISEVTGNEPQIKWVNDIFLNGKKVCGILTDAFFNLETGMPDYIILGIGFNVYEPVGGFPQELTGIAGAILHAAMDDSKNRLAAAFLNFFMQIYRDKANADYARYYRNHSMVIGHPVTVVSAGTEKQGFAVDVDADCRLLVRYPDGSVERLFSAEVSIRE